MASVAMDSLPYATALNAWDEEDEPVVKYEKGRILANRDLERGDFIMFERPMVKIVFQSVERELTPIQRTLLEPYLREQDINGNCILCQMTAYALTFTAAAKRFNQFYKVSPIEIHSVALSCQRMQDIWDALPSDLLPADRKATMRAFLECHALISRCFFSYETYWSKNSVLAHFFCFRASFFRSRCCNPNASVAVCHDGIRIYADVAVKKGDEIFIPTDDPMLGVLAQERRKAVLAIKRGWACKCTDCTTPQDDNRGELFKKLMQFVPDPRVKETLTLQNVKKLALGVCKLDDKLICFFVMHALCMISDVEKFMPMVKYASCEVEKETQSERAKREKDDVHNYALAMSILIHRVCEFLHHVARRSSRDAVWNACPWTHVPSLRLFGSIVAAAHRRVFKASDFARFMQADKEHPLEWMVDVYRECTFEMMLRYQAPRQALVDDILTLVAVYRSLTSEVDLPFQSSEFWNRPPSFVQYASKQLSRSQNNEEKRKEMDPRDTAPRLCMQTPRLEPLKRYAESLSRPTSANV